MKFNRDTILFAISISAFVMSALTWILTFFHHRKNIDVHVYMCRRGNNAYTMYVGFENKSRLPIAITRIFLEVDSKLYECKSAPVTVLTKTNRVGKEVVARSEYMNLKMPLSLTDLGSESGYLVFFDCPEIPEALPTEATFVMHSNRGKIIRSVPVSDRYDPEEIA